MGKLPSLNIYCGNLTNDSNPDFHNDYKDYTLKYMYVFSSNNEVRFDEFSDGNPLPSNPFSFELTDDNIFLEDADGHFQIKISFNKTFDDFKDTSGNQLPQNTIFEINRLALVMSNTDDGSGDLKVFSSIKFDPIVISTESIINLTYYVYF